MIEWISETFNLLFSGANQILVAALRLGIVFIALVIAWAYIKAVIKDPVVMVRGTIAVVSMPIVGFGSILYVPDYLPLPTIIVWIGGWVAAYYVAGFIGGWHDEKESDKAKKSDH